MPGTCRKNPDLKEPKPKKAQPEKKKGTDESVPNIYREEIEAAPSCHIHVTGIFQPASPGRRVAACRQTREPEVDGCMPVCGALAGGSGHRVDCRAQALHNQQAR